MLAEDPWDELNTIRFFAEDPRAELGNTSFVFFKTELSQKCD